MKINKAKFVVTSLAICCSAALIGSITNTIAWYQFSTRASAVYLGASTGKNSKLHLRIKGTDNWITDLTYRDVNDYLVSINKGLAITPITSGPMGADDPIKTDDDGKMVFYQNPDGETTLERVKYDNLSWRRADELMYVSLPLELSYIEDDGSVNHYLEKDVYISNLTIQGDYRNHIDGKDKKDLSKAVRVHIGTYQSNSQSDTSFNRLISKNGGTVLTEGYLDGDGDGDIDEYIEGHGGPIYDGFHNEEEVERHYVNYGEGLQVSYSNQYDIQDGSYKTLDGQNVNEKIYPAVVKSLDNSSVLDENSFEYKKEGSDETTSKCIGKTVAFEGEQNEAYLNVIMTIWVEGWELLPSSSNSDDSSIWNAYDYIGSMFDIGIEFAVQPN